MCGINGIFSYEKQVDPQTVHRMNNALSHRGPDDEGLWSEDRLVVGHRRLSIIDLSKDGHQPFESGDWVLVYNGELYNYKALRSELSANFTFRTQTDTEVVLAAWQTWGRDALQRFNGMFAFALWNKQTKELFIVRDRLGIKPLYYHKTDNTVAFSSEMRALMASDLFPRKLDHTALVDYLRYQTVHWPRTIIANVNMLPPGHLLHVREDDASLVQWYDLSEQHRPEVNDLSATEIQKEVKNKLFQAVERRMVADVPFGAFLSGGIDSSAVVGIMSQVAAKQVKTFSVTFNEEEFSEAKYARMIAEKFKTDHHEIKLTANDFYDAIPDALAAMDHPSGDGPNTYIVSKATKAAGITMALSGLGGDELFAGYEIFKRSMSLSGKKWMLSFPKFSRRLGGNVLKKMKPGPGSDKIAETLILDYFDPDHTYPISRQVLMDDFIRKLTDRQNLPPNAVKAIAQEFTAYGTQGYKMPELSHTSLNEIHTYMQNVLLRDTDQMSMASALEVRVPFLDHELVEFVLNIRDTVKYPHSQKKLLVESLGDLLPPEIVNRPKMGFVLPWEQWLKKEMRPMAEEALKALSARGILKAEVLDEVWSRFLKDDPRFSWSRVWPLVVLENWMQRHHVEA